VQAIGAGAVLAVVQGIVSGLGSQSVFTFQGTNTAGAHGAFVGGSVIGGIVMALLWLWMAWKNRAGRPWARVLSTVFFGIMCLDAVLNAIGLVAAAARGDGLIIVSGVIALIEWAVGLAAIILLYRPESGQFYAAASGRGYPPAPPGYGYGYGQPGYGQAGYGQPPGFPPPGGEQPPAPYGQDPAGPPA